MALSTINSGTDMKVFEIVAHGGPEIVDGIRRERREHLGYVSARTSTKALDVMCERVNADEPDSTKHIRRVGGQRQVNVLGIGSIKAHEVTG